jgi:hypothetical protein
MDKKYITLFKDLAQSTASSAETVMDYDREKNDQKGLETAQTMRDDFQDLANRINTTEYTMTKSDAAKLLVGTMIITNQIQDRINGLKKAMTGYQTDVIPKLQEIVDNANTDEEANELANKKFIIEDND